MVFSIRAQSSFEYIMLIAIVLLFVVSGVGVVYHYSQRSTEDVQTATIEKIGTDILDTVEKVYFIGGDSWETIRLNIPKNVKGVYVLDNQELIIEYDSYGGISEAVFFSDVNLTTPYVSGNRANLSDFAHSGINLIRVVSSGGYVNISELK
ncbi:hypothetical protein JW826_01310 [Candidatus Woesearchaeota archaeon]|nr:hypothetical protein [Candidatus Woesearchaeota archaeon]